MRNLNPKDKNVRVVQAVVSDGITTVTYEGYGRQVVMRHATGGKGWRVVHPGHQNDLHKKAKAIALVADLLKNGD